MPKGIKTHALYLMLFIIIIIRIEIRTLADGVASKDIMHETHAAGSFGGVQAQDFATSPVIGTDQIPYL